MKIIYLLVYVVLVFNIIFYSIDNIQKNYFHKFNINDMSEKNINETENEKFDSNLCKNSENLVFSFKYKDSDKVLVLAENKQKDYLVCRIGTQDAIETEFPKNKDCSWDEFEYSYYNRGGGSENLGLNLEYLTFNENQKKYQIYYIFDAVKNSTSVGIYIENANGEIEDIRGDLNSVKGNLNTLYYTKIKKEFA